MFNVRNTNISKIITCKFNSDSFYNYLLNKRIAKKMFFDIEMNVFDLMNVHDLMLRDLKIKRKFRSF